MIRLATADDLPAIADAVRLASDELAKTFDTPDTSIVILTGAAHGIERNQGVVVAEDADGRVVGFVVWVWYDGVSPTGAVEGLGTWVHPEFRGSGLSAAMREVAAERCLEAGREYVSGVVALGNEAGMKSAEAMGLAVVGHVVRGSL